jgi:hypothetical protein
MLSVAKLNSIAWKDDTWKMNRKGRGMKRSWPNWSYYPGICLEGQKKTTKTLIRIASLQAKIWTLDVPYYEAGVLTTWPQCLVQRRTWEDSTEWSKSHATHKSVTRENFTIMLVVIFILYVGTTVFPPCATGAGVTLTPSSTPSVEWERYLWQDGFFARSTCFYSWTLLFHSVICRMSECV